MNTQIPKPTDREKIKNTNPVRPCDLPGPGGVPLLGAAPYLRGTQLHLKLEQWVETYGERYTFKLGSIQVVVLTDSVAIRELLAQRPHGFTRGRKLRAVFDELQLNGVFAAEGDHWRRDRKLVMPGFLPGQLERFFPQILMLVERFRDRLMRYAKSGTPVQLASEFMRFTTDVTMRLAFGYESDLLGDQESELHRDVQLIFPTLSRRMYAAVPYWRYFQLPRDRKVAAAMLRVQARMREIAATARARLEASPEAREAPKTALEAMLALEFLANGEGRMSEQEVLANMLTLLLAGEETTSNTLAWIAYELLCAPEIQTKLQAEVDRELPSRLGLEQFRDPQRLSYLEGLAQETLRVRSTTPIMFMQATETTVIDGVELTPKDLVVILSRVGAMREKNFSDAKSFCPERWNRSDLEMAARCPAHEPKSVMTFGSGPRICPGRNLALLEIHAVVSMLARNFVLEWDGDPVQVEEIFEFTVRPSPYRARLRLREGVSPND